MGFVSVIQLPDVLYLRLRVVNRNTGMGVDVLSFLQMLNWCLGGLKQTMHPENICNVASVL